MENYMFEKDCSQEVQKKASLLMKKANLDSLSAISIGMDALKNAGFYVSLTGDSITVELDGETLYSDCFSFF